MIIFDGIFPFVEIFCVRLSLGSTILIELESDVETRISLSFSC